MTTLVRLLFSVAVVGMLSASVGSATFATFSAQTTNLASVMGGTVAMTNVAGTAAGGTDCATGTTSGTCAVIFDATALSPGGADRTNTVTIAYVGSLVTSDFRLFATGYETRSVSSSALCTAADPASKLRLQVKQGATVIYPASGSGYGTIAGFAATHGTAAAGIQLKGAAGTAGVWSSADTASFTVAVGLDASADNAYQGCRSLVTLAWYAAQ